MSYRSDQWFRLNNTEATGESLSVNFASNRAGAFVTGATNLPFRYPDRSIRDMDGNSRPPMKRGYIRSLAFGEDRANFSIQKCQFQFNPSQIAQSVQQNTAVLNFIQQDPAQYAQPMPGNVTFSFDLFFDRSAELNDNNLPFSRLDTSNPWETGNPAEIGVLHDLSQLYKVIGVGVNSTMTEYLTKTAIAASNAEIADAENDSDAETLPEFDSEEFSSDVNSFMDYNVGNTAFLLPLPCRIVFSSLYIVEGLVKDINVMFTKFTETMVPMQCSVQVMFEAKYIGFAKKNTFFEYALRELEKVEPTTPSSAILTAYYEALSTDFSSVQMVCLDEESNLVKSAGHRNRNFNTEADGNQIIDLVSYRATGSKLAENKAHVKILFPRESDSQRIRSLMVANGLNVNISASGYITLYRYTLAVPGNDKQGFTELNPTLYANVLANTSPYSPGIGSIGSSPSPTPSGSIPNFERLENGIRTYMTRTAAQGGATVLLPEDLAPDPDEYPFKNAIRLFRINLSSSNALDDDGVAEANNVQDWDRMMEWACVSKAQALGPAGGSDNDTSTSSTEDNIIYPVHGADSKFAYLAKFEVTLSITIDNTTQTISGKDYRLYTTPIGTTSNQLVKTISLNWPAPDNPVPADDPASVFDPTVAGAPAEAYEDTPTGPVPRTENSQPLDYRLPLDRSQGAYF